MGYSRENIRRVREAYSEKAQKAREEAQIRRDELWIKFPDIKAIDREIADIGFQAVRMAVGGGEGVPEKIQKFKEQSLELQRIRGEMLLEKGYPSDYTSVHYECEKCEDTGYVDTKMCDCMKRALILAGYESSGISRLMRSQTFDTFSLDYYKKSPDVYDKMKQNFDFIKSFAEGFSAGASANLAFFGGTGLGKTHLSTAVAKTVIDKGYDVLYVTALSMLADFEKERFGSGYSDTDVSDLSRYYDADLLIVDDIGTEVNNQFTVSTIYNIINTRLSKGKSTVISTNLTPAELRTRYWDRIASRIFGEYTPIIFEGTDVRMQKLMSDKK